MKPWGEPSSQANMKQGYDMAKQQAVVDDAAATDLAEADRNRASSESPMIQAVNSSTKASAMEATISVTTANNSLG